jgi:hypothetical protein
METSEGKRTMSVEEQTNGIAAMTVPPALPSPPQAEAIFLPSKLAPKEPTWHPSCSSFATTSLPENRSN